jgi:hypothetical protein
MTPPHIRCPACGAVSSHPKDIKEGYCGRCHAWTADDTEPAHLTRGPAMTGTTTSTPESRARLAYTAYGKAVGFRTHDDKPMPAFDELSETTRSGWQAAAGLIWDLATTGRATL